MLIPGIDCRHKTHPAIEAYNRMRRAVPTSDLDGSLLLAEIGTHAYRRIIHGADSPDLIDSICASMVQHAGPAGRVEERPPGNTVDTGKPHLWDTLLFCNVGKRYVLEGA